MKIYTKTGDSGETSLVGGSRIFKSSSRVALYGEVDELNSAIGLAIAHSSHLLTKDSSDLLLKIQSSLFDMGSNLACKKMDRQKFLLPELKEEILDEIEKEIDAIEGQLPKLQSFILPGGSIPASQFHVARAICRRVERKLVRYTRKHEDEFPLLYIAFLNRLSDYLFTQARYMNLKLKAHELLWKKG